jgi:hypothetical protein
VKRANPPEVFERWATDQKLAAKAAKAITPGTG